MTLTDDKAQHESTAVAMDEADPLSTLRASFHIPTALGEGRGEPSIYFCGNSLGLQPRRARVYVEEVLEAWAKLGVDAHLEGASPWLPYHECFAHTGARLVGARVGEVVMMNSLTINLHLLLTTFYRPEGRRRKLLMESPAFPSDIYCLRSHVAARGLDPDEEIVALTPREGEDCLHTADIVEAIETCGAELATVLIGGVNFLTGQVFDMPAITQAGHRAGAKVGFDLAHAVGNIPLALHDWDVDFAAWCSYKYLNASPGAVAGAFIHERHASDPALPRLAGWWGNDPATRFRMHLEDRFIPVPTAESWQVSNPPILAMAPLRASLEIFDQVGMEALRERSLRLTGYLRMMLESRPGRRYKIITPRQHDAHGAQLSIVVGGDASEAFRTIEASGVVADFRPPNVIRVAPTPLYNSFSECWRFAMLFGRLFGDAAT